MRETRIQSLGREDPLEKEMAIHSSTMPGKSHGQRSLVGYSPWGRKESDTTEQLHFHFYFTSFWVWRKVKLHLSFFLYKGCFEDTILQRIIPHRVE